MDGDLDLVRVAVLDRVRVAVGDLLAGGGDGGRRVRDAADVRVAVRAAGVRAAVGEAARLALAVRVGVEVGAAVGEPARLALALLAGVALVDTDALVEPVSEALLDAVPLRDVEAVPEVLGVDGGVPVAVLVPAPLADGMLEGTVVPVAEPVPELLDDRVDEGEGGA